MTPADRYHYSVHWSEKDGSFIGTVLELPSLKSLNANPAGAFAGIWTFAHEVAEDFTVRGEWVPEPLSGAAELRAHLRGVAYRMVANGTYKQGDPAIARSLDDARSLLREYPG